MCGKIFSLGLHSPALLSRVPYVDFELEDNDTGKLERSEKKKKGNHIICVKKKLNLVQDIQNRVLWL